MIRREMTAQYSGNYRDFRVLRCLTVIDIFQKDPAVELKVFSNKQRILDQVISLL